MCRVKVDMLNGISKSFAEAFLEDAGYTNFGSVSLNSPDGIIVDTRYRKAEGPEVHEVFFTTLYSREGTVKKTGSWFDAGSCYNPLCHTDAYSLA